MYYIFLVLVYTKKILIQSDIRLLVLKKRILLIGNLGAYLINLPKNNFNYSFKENYLTLSGEDLSSLNTINSIILRLCLEINYGVSQALELRGLGFKVFHERSKLRFLLGFSHEKLYTLPKEVSAKVVDKKNTKFVLKSNNTSSLSNVIQDLKKLKPLDAYKGKGISIIGEYIPLKPGKKEFR